VSAGRILVLAWLGLTALGGAGTWLFARARWRRASERERTVHEMRDLTGRLINAQEAERSRIARELHDDLSQSIALMSVRLDMLAQRPPEASKFAGEMRDLAGQMQRISTEMHRISHELHPAKLRQLGLVPALRGFCRETGAAHGIPIGFIHDAVSENLPLEIALCLYRVAQESIHNVIKHAGGTHAEVRIRVRGDELRMAITDDGVGFDADSPQGTSSLGFVSMKERVRLVNGTLKIDSQPSKGTRVEVIVRAPEAG
jgi:signal transduction histidine kinase